MKTKLFTLLAGVCFTILTGCTNLSTKNEQSNNEPQTFLRIDVAYAGFTNEDLARLKKKTPKSEKEPAGCLFNELSDSRSPKVIKLTEIHKNYFSHILEYLEDNDISHVYNAGHVKCTPDNTTAEFHTGEKMVLYDMDFPWGLNLAIKDMYFQAKENCAEFNSHCRLQYKSSIPLFDEKKSTSFDFANSAFSIPIILPAIDKNAGVLILLQVQDNSISAPINRSKHRGVHKHPVYRWFTTKDPKAVSNIKLFTIIVLRYVTNKPSDD